MNPSNSQFTKNIISILEKNNIDLEKINLWMLQSSTRFFPFWKTYSNEQLEGLVNLIMHIYIKNKNISKVLEIGSHIGESACIFSSFPFIKKVYCVDIWENDIYYKIFLEKMRDYILNKKCIHLKLSSEEASKKIKENFDLIYIDGAHDFNSVKKDLEIWAKRINDKGFLCGHDYGAPAWPGTKKAIDDFIRDNPNSFSGFTTFCDRSWCMQKI